jgi:hypothetical protein
VWYQSNPLTFFSKKRIYKLQTHFFFVPFFVPTPKKKARLESDFSKKFANQNSKAGNKREGTNPTRLHL